jgi:hypothetical protein
MVPTEMHNGLRATGTHCSRDSRGSIRLLNGYHISTEWVPLLNRMGTTFRNNGYHQLVAPLQLLNHQLYKPSAFKHQLCADARRDAGRFVYLLSFGGRSGWEYRIVTTATHKITRDTCCYELPYTLYGDSVSICDLCVLQREALIASQRLSRKVFSTCDTSPVFPVCR